MTGEHFLSYEAVLTTVDYDKTRRRTRASIRLGEPHHRLDERAHAEAGAALADVAVVRVRTRRAGDVEVDPRHVADELLQEQPGGQRAAVAAGADVLDVGDVASRCRLR